MEKKLQKISVLLLAMLLVAAMLPAVSAQAQSSGAFAGGSGTEADPWLIETAQQLDAVREYVGDDNAGRHFALVADIDVGSLIANQHNEELGIKGWQPIGTYFDPYEYNAQFSGHNASFQGVLDGRGHTISGLWIESVGLACLGLFGYLEDASVTNLGIVMDREKGGISVNYRGINQGHFPPYIGGIAGYVNADPNPNLIQNCFVDGVFTADSYTIAGGIVGKSEALWASNDSANEISGCAANIKAVSNAQGALNVGGILGFWSVGGSGSIKDCYSSLTLEGTGYLASDNDTSGIVSHITNWGNGTQTIDNCYALLQNTAPTSSWHGAICGRASAVEDSGLTIKNSKYYHETRSSMPGAVADSSEGVLTLEDDTKYATLEQLAAWQPAKGSIADFMWTIDADTGTPRSNNMAATPTQPPAEPKPETDSAASNSTPRSNTSYFAGSSTQGDKTYHKLAFWQNIHQELRALPQGAVLVLDCSDADYLPYYVISTLSQENQTLIMHKGLDIFIIRGGDAMQLDNTCNYRFEHLTTLLPVREAQNKAGGVTYSS